MERTAICLDTSGHLAGSDGVEIGDILTQNSLQVPLTETFGVDLGRVHPCVHVHKHSDEGRNTWK